MITLITSRNMMCGSIKNLADTKISPISCLCSVGSGSQAGLTSVMSLIKTSFQQLVCMSVLGSLLKKQRPFQGISLRFGGSGESSSILGSLFTLSVRWTLIYPSPTTFRCWFPPKIVVAITCSFFSNCLCNWHFFPPKKRFVCKSISVLLWTNENSQILFRLFSVSLLKAITSGFRSEFH